jgi:hypothetical protein
MSCGAFCRNSSLGFRFVLAKSFFAIPKISTARLAGGADFRVLSTLLLLALFVKIILNFICEEIIKA